MFLCGQCHVKSKVPGWDLICETSEQIWISYGACENCKTLTGCVDCKAHHRHVPCRWCKKPNAVYIYKGMRFCDFDCALDAAHAWEDRDYPDDNET